MQGVVCLTMKEILYTINGERVGEIVKDSSLLGTKYHITGLDWKFKGDISDHKYSILNGKNTIVTVRKKDWH